MSRRSLVLVWLAVSSLLAVGGLAVAGAPFASAASTLDYVAMGDSYSSGVGSPGTVGTCARGPGSYAALFATDHGPASFRFVACSGATTDDVLSNQLGALNADTDLVSITIGGNDAGFFPTLAACVSGGSDEACEQTVGAAQDTFEETLPGKLKATYRAIRERAPGATVVVLGYPILFDLGPECAVSDLSVVKRQVLNAGADDLARVIGNSAKAAGFRFVDTREAFGEHGICTAVPWVNNLSLSDPAESFHPNGAGYERGYLQALNGAVSAAVADRR